jgi:hypothetical protein
MNVWCAGMICIAAALTGSAMAQAASVTPSKGQTPEQT